MTDRVVLVTGSTRGLGRAMASGVLSAGASVVITGRSQDACDATAGALASGANGAILPLSCDVTDWDAVPAFVETVRARLGKIDVLVNNAGFTPRKTPVDRIERSDWQAVFAANLEAPLRLSQCVAPIMRDAGGGTIVNIASAAAYSGRPLSAAYGAAKAGLISLTKSMATAWASWGIRVNAISPGPFMTDSLAGSERANPGVIDRAVKGTLMKRVADPAEIVGTLLYLASDASSFVTGDDVVVAGGLIR